MQFVIVGCFILLFCLISVIRLFKRGHKTLGKLWIIFYIGSLLTALFYGFAAAIPLCIFCVIAFIIR